jgi:hypothetical protein
MQEAEVTKSCRIEYTGLFEKFYKNFASDDDNDIHAAQKKYLEAYKQGY